LVNVIRSNKVFLKAVLSLLSELLKAITAKDSKSAFCVSSCRCCHSQMAVKSTITSWNETIIAL